MKQGEPTLAISSDRPYAQVEVAVRTLAREGLRTRELGMTEVASEVARTACGAVVFTMSAGLAACLANKIPGVRAVPVATVAQANQAALDVGVNLLAVEMPGRTFFEVRQMLRIMFGLPSCPQGLAATLEGLERAHR